MPPGPARGLIIGAECWVAAGPKLTTRIRCPRGAMSFPYRSGNRRSKASVGPIEVGELRRYDRPLPDTADYDLLLEGVT